jgi:hypothetical protein
METDVVSRRRCLRRPERARLVAVARERDHEAELVDRLVVRVHRATVDDGDGREREVPRERLFRLLRDRPRDERDRVVTARRAEEHDGERVVHLARAVPGDALVGERGM